MPATTFAPPMPTISLVTFMIFQKQTTYHLPILLMIFVDTTFMYVISMLCMLKIYQSRHPDINAEAHAAFAVLAFVVLIGVVSVFEDTLSFRIIFSAMHLLACLALSAQVYYMGRWKLSMYTFVNLKIF